MLTFLLFAVFSLSLTQRIDSSAPRCNGTINSIPLFTDPPTLVKKVQHGSRYDVGDPSHNSSLSIVHLYGDSSTMEDSAFQMGYAYGQLLHDELWPFLLTDLENELFDELQDLFKDHLSDKVLKLIEEFGLFPLLDVLWYRVKDFTPSYFVRILEGVAEGSGVSYSRLLYYNLMPVLLHAGCTIVGATGKGSATSELAQLRALDLGPTMPMLHYPVLSVFHFDDDSSNDVVNFAGVGFMGYLTGMAKIKDGGGYLSMSEKVWINSNFPDTEFPKGIPWQFDFFNTLRYASSLKEGVTMLEESQRTATVFVGLGQHEAKEEDEFRLITYNVPGFGKFETWSWETQPVYEEHPRFTGVAYVDKHPQPTHHYCLSDLLESTKGKLTGETLALNIAAMGQTGNLQVVSWDWSEMVVYVSSSAGQGYEPKFAYEKQFVKLRIEEDLFGVKW